MSLSNERKIDVLFEAVQRLDNIRENLHDTIFSDLPFDYEDCRAFFAQNGIHEINSFDFMLKDAKDYALSVIRMFEHSNPAAISY